MGGSRARRIAEELGSRGGWTVEAVRDLQLDLRARQPEPFLAVLRPLLGDTPNERLLRDWDLRYDAASRGATLFERFYRALNWVHVKLASGGTGWVFKDLVKVVKKEK